MPGFEACASLDERKRAQVFAVLEQKIVDADVRRKVAQHLRGDGFAVEALLQIVERRDGAVSHHEQLAVDDAVGAPKRRADFRKSRRDVVAHAREHFDVAADCCDLNADAVPFPFGGEVFCGEFRPVVVLDRMREHDRAEGRLEAGIGFVGSAVEPGEEFEVGRLERVPDFLDLADVAAVGFGERGAGEPRRDADARRAADQLQRRPSPRGVERVEDVPQSFRAFGRRAGLHRGDDEIEGWGVRYAPRHQSLFS